MYPKTALNVHFYMYKRTVCYEKLVHECSFLEKYVSFLRTNFILLIVVERKLYKTKLGKGTRNKLTLLMESR